MIPYADHSTRGLRNHQRISMEVHWGGLTEKSLHVEVADSTVKIERLEPKEKGSLARVHLNVVCVEGLGDLLQVSTMAPVTRGEATMILYMDGDVTKVRTGIKEKGNRVCLTMRDFHKRGTDHNMGGLARRGETARTSSELGNPLI